MANNCMDSIEHIDSDKNALNKSTRARASMCDVLREKLKGFIPDEDLKSFFKYDHEKEEEEEEQKALRDGSR